MRGVRTMFLPAVMLQYELHGGTRNRQQIAFAVDGVINEAYEKAFAACGGPDKLPDLTLPSFKTTQQLVAEFVPPHLAAKIGDVRDVDELTERFEAAAEKVESSSDRIEATDRPDTRRVLRDELDRERAEKARLEKELNHRQVRRLRTYDCQKLLHETLEKVAERLVIVSAFLSTDAVDRTFLGQLEQVLRRGVKVWIGYGMGHHGQKQHEREESLNWVRAEEALNDLRKRYKSLFELRDFGDTHEKILICDGQYVVTGSYNWLSFKPNPKSKKRRHEDAVMVLNSDLVEQYFTELSERFSRRT